MSLRAYQSNSIENTPPAVLENRVLQEKRLRKKLLRYGLEDIRVDVLVYKAVYKWSFREIKGHLGIPSESTVFDIYHKAIELLKERGLKPYG